MYLVVTKRTIHHEGDERSRTNPGHGYPAYSEKVESVRTFATEKELLDWAKNRPSEIKGAQVYKAEKIELVTEIKLSVK
jgi:hypothetical protein